MNKENMLNDIENNLKMSVLLMEHEEEVKVILKHFIEKTIELADIEGIDRDFVMRTLCERIIDIFKVGTFKNCKIESPEKKTPPVFNKHIATLHNLDYRELAEATHGVGDIKLKSEIKDRDYTYSGTIIGEFAFVPFPNGVEVWTIESEE